MRSSNKKIILGVCLTASLALAVTVGTSTYKFMSLVKSYSVSQHIVQATNDVTVTLINAETGERGFIITGDEAYLQPYNNSKIILSGQLNVLKNLTESQSINHPDIESIIKLAADKMDKLTDGIRIRREQGFDVVRNMYKAGNGKAEMDEVRALVAGIGFEEVLRSDKLSLLITDYAQIMAIGTILLAVCLMLVVGLFNNYYKNRYIDS